MADIRVRFAPSPTGALHIGGARTALFNWFFARHHGGKFVLRIEDTDTQRTKEGSEEGILDGFRWLGLTWDEGPLVGGAFGPYYQSQRQGRHQEIAQKLLEAGQVYPCYCSVEELSQRRAAAMRANKAPRYDGHCRHLTVAEIEAYRAEGRKPVLRLAVPEKGSTVVSDIVRGQVEFQNEILDDFVIVKSDGMAAYNFACVVDDHDMQISHVIRAEEHLSNTPKQILVYQAMQWPVPQFAHLPMILAPDRAKLSKRHGATSIQEFRDQGFLAEALMNYLTLLGWAPDGVTEILTTEQAAEWFTLDRVGKNAAVYDIKKLQWLNGQYLRSLPVAVIAERAKPFFAQAKIDLTMVSEAVYVAIVGLVRDRVETLVQVADAARYFFEDVVAYDEKGVKKQFEKEGAESTLRALQHFYATAPEFSKEALEEGLTELATNLGVKRGDLIHPTRLAITGRTVGPGLFDIIVQLGQQKVVERLENAASAVANHRVALRSDNL